MDPRRSPLLLWGAAISCMVGACGGPQGRGGADDQAASWAIALPSSSYSGVRAVAAHPSGEITIAGSFRARLELGNNPSSAGADDGFVARLDPAGKLRWLVQLAGPGADSITALASRGEDVVLAGSFSGSARLGDRALRATGEPASVVAALDGSGAVLWHRVLDASDFVIVRGLAVDPLDGAIALVGSFAGDLATGDPMSSAGVHDALIARLDAGGAIQWTRRLGGSYPDFAHAVAAGNGRIAVAGSFGVEAEVGGGHPPLASGGRSLDAFVAVYEKSGKVAWARSAGGGGRDTAMGVVIGADGRVCHGGSFMQEGRFGGLTLRGAGEDVYVACSSAKGRHLWSLALRGSGDERVTALIASGRRLVIAGTLDGTMTAGKDNLESAGKHDVFVAVVSDEGQPLRGFTLGGGNEESAGGIAAHPLGDWIVGGSFSGTPGIAGVPLTARARINGFVARVGP